MAKREWNPWDPWSGDDVSECVDRLMGEALRGFEHSRKGSGKAYVWEPGADVMETCDSIIIHVELPGVCSSRIMLEMRDKLLYLYGERRFEKDVDVSAYHVMERSHGPFARTFQLPESIEAEGIEAVFREGLLTVTLPKRSTRRHRKIKIEIG
jgi:HSP20 family protein